MASDQDKPLIRGDSQTAGHPSYTEAATQEKTGQASQNQACIVSLVGKVVFKSQGKILDLACNGVDVIGKIHQHVRYKLLVLYVFKVTILCWNCELISIYYM
jgi:hypothetical protein